MNEIVSLDRVLSRPRHGQNVIRDPSSKRKLEGQFDAMLRPVEADLPMRINATDGHLVFRPFGITVFTFGAIAADLAGDFLRNYAPHRLHERSIGRFGGRHFAETGQ